MSEGAKVESIDDIKLLRAGLVKFAEAAQSSLWDGDSDVSRTMSWLERDQTAHWQGQLKKRKEGLDRANESLRMKKVFKDATGRTQSAVEEEKAVRLWKARVEEAEQKIIACRRYLARIEKEQMNFKGSVQRLSTAIESTVPTALADLDRFVDALERYVGFTPTMATSQASESGFGGAGEGGGFASIARAAPGDVPTGGGYAPWRRATPRPDERAAAEAIDGPPPDALLAALPPLDEAARAALANLRTPDFAWPTGATMTFALTGGEPQAYLERTEPAGGGDSGWYAGAPAGTAEGARLRRVAIADVLAARPQWADVLALPPRSMAAIVGGALVAVVSEQDRMLWTAAHAPAGTP